MISTCERRLRVNSGTIRFASLFKKEKKRKVCELDDRDCALQLHVCETHNNNRELLPCVQNVVRKYVCSNPKCGHPEKHD